MVWLIVILAVLVACGVIGLILSGVDARAGLNEGEGPSEDEAKSDEHIESPCENAQQGLGTKSFFSRRIKRGKLLRTQLIHKEAEIPIPRVFVQALLPAFVLSCVLAFLAISGVLAAYSNVATVVSLGVSLAFAIVVCGNFVSSGRAFCYAISGLVIACALVVVVMYVFPDIATVEVNALTMILGSLGAAVGAAVTPPRAIFAREFADTTQNSCCVSMRSRTYRALYALQDSSWEVSPNLIDAAKRIYGKRNKA